MNRRQALAAVAACSEIPPPRPTAISIPEMIREAAERWGVSADEMLFIAQYESGMGTDSNAYNGRSGYYGLFQIAPLTWHDAAFHTGLAGANPYDNRANIEVAMYIAKTRGFSPWSCRRHG